MSPPAAGAHAGALCIFVTSTVQSAINSVPFDHAQLWGRSETDPPTLTPYPLRMITTRTPNRRNSSVGDSFNFRKAGAAHQEMTS